MHLYFFAASCPEIHWKHLGQFFKNQKGPYRFSSKRTVPILAWVRWIEVFVLNAVRTLYASGGGGGGGGGRRALLTKPID